MTEQKFSEWVVLELMGHRRLAGLLTEQEIAGHGFLRIEIPAVPAEPAKHVRHEADSDHCSYWCTTGRPAVPGATQFYAPSSVYGITPVSEEIARRMAAGLRHEPVTRFELPLLPQPAVASSDIEDQMETEMDRVDREHEEAVP